MNSQIIRILKISFSTILIFVLAASLTANYFFWPMDGEYYDDEYYGNEYVDEEIEEGACNIKGIELHGDLYTYLLPSETDEEGYVVEDVVASQDIAFFINEANKDENIKAIVLEVDSYGGMPVAAEEVANALKDADKPTVALIREAGLSAAYWASTGADIIFASANSDVGSIGVTMSYLDNVAMNEKEGLTYNQLSTGKFKDSGDPNKPLTDEEKELFMRDNQILHDNFVKAVAENRGLGLEKVKELADGSSMLGQMAMENGLIDKIGSLYEVEDYLKQKIGEEAEICWH